VSEDQPPTGSLLRRIRRSADLSQRDLARALGVAASAVAQVEAGSRDLPVGVLTRAAQLAGLRLALLDAGGAEVAGMAPGAVRDAAGRHFPAHLDTRYGDEDWWHGDERYSRQQPWYTFDRTRERRDGRRESSGTAPDHQLPRAGDSPRERARARQAAVDAARTARARAAAQQRQRLWIFDDLDLTCTCPAACDELLFPSAPLTARQNAVPHVEDCLCRCDIA
jgi:transcriptional regulator with XRE-family HTH domain